MKTGRHLHGENLFVSKLFHKYIFFLHLYRKLNIKLLIACSCPSTHPWPYLNGIYCCATNREKNDSQKNGTLCDGSIIELGSACCENDEYHKCTSPPCHFNGETSTSISTTTKTISGLTNIPF